MWRCLFLTEYELSNKKISELREIAKALDIQSPYKYKKDELIKLILENKENLEDDTISIEDIDTEELPEKVSEELENMDTINLAEGILELHADGYGFLRSDNYLSGEEDIYISPSQIRRFRLRTGDKICGVTRDPNQGERFKALLYIKSVNGMHPETSPRSASFKY